VRESTAVRETGKKVNQDLPVLKRNALKDNYLEVTRDTIAKWENAVKRDPKANWCYNIISEILPFAKEVMPRVARIQIPGGLSIISLEGNHKENEEEIVKYGLEPLVKSGIFTQGDVETVVKWYRSVKPTYNWNNPKPFEKRFEIKGQEYCLITQYERNSRNLGLLVVRAGEGGDSTAADSAKQRAGPKKAGAATTEAAIIDIMIENERLAGAVDAKLMKEIDRMLDLGNAYVEVSELVAVEKIAELLANADTKDGKGMKRLIMELGKGDMDFYAPVDGMSGLKLLKLVEIRSRLAQPLAEIDTIEPGLETYGLTDMGSMVAAKLAELEMAPNPKGAVKRAPRAADWALGILLRDPAAAP
jgi:hypothetical protein